MNDKIEPEIPIVRTVPLLPERSKVQPSAPGFIEREDDIKKGRQIAHPQEHSALMDKPQSDLKPSDFAAASPVKFQQNAAQKRFLEDDLKVLRKELDAMPTMGAICIFTVQLMGVIPIIMCIPSCTASDESGGIIILASVWTVIWCLCSIWVCYPLAQALKLENSSEIGLLSGLPLYGPIVIMSLAKKAKETVSIQP